MTSRLGAIVCFFGLAVGQVVPAFAQSAAARYLPPANQSASAAASWSAPTNDTYYRPAPCSDAVIRAAAAKKVAPPLVGCAVADTYSPLLQFFLIVPRVHKTDSTEPAGRILSQSPAAGTPLDKAGKLSFDVSTGTPPQEKPATSAEVPATSAAPEKPQARLPVSSAAPPDMPAPTSPAAPFSETSPASTAASAEPAEATQSSAPGPTMPPLTDARVVFADKGVSWWRAIQDGATANPLLVLLGAVLAIGVIGLSLNGRKTGRKSSRALPRITCEATFGPGRLVRRGSLVLGEKGGD